MVEPAQTRPSALVKQRFTRADFERDGFALIPGILEAATVDALIAACEQYAAQAVGASRRDGRVYGLRNLRGDVPPVAEAAYLPAVRSSVASVLGEGAFMVRTIYFDKTPEANWHVTWHQDVTIAVRERVEAPGFGPWSRKAGVVHVQPPVDVLKHMVALRLHLDDCDADNGPLRVLPGTHDSGKWTEEAIARLRGLVPEVVCTMKRGDGLLMRLLLLHASGVATGSAVHRRVLHLEWANTELPDGLDWQHRA